MMNAFDIIVRLRNNDHTALEEIFKTHCENLTKIAYRIVGSYEEAEDIVSELMASLWVKRDRLTTVMNISAYLYIAVRHNCYKRRQSATHRFYHQHLDISPDTITQLPEAESKANVTDLVLHIQKALEAGEPQCREVMRLYLFEYLEPQEVAMALNISLQQVRTQMSKGWKIIRNYLSKNRSNRKGPPGLLVWLLLALLLLLIK